MNNLLLYRFIKMKMQEIQRKSFQKFVNAVNNMGGTVLDDFSSYVNNRTKIRCICPQGHQINITTGGVISGQGMCAICTGHSIEAAEEKFRNIIRELGGKIIGVYIDTNTPIELICKNNHTSSVRPGWINSKRRFCAACVGHCPIQAEKNFIKRIEELGGKVIGKYNKSSENVLCICKNGHECNPMPTSIQSGQGMCLVCANKCPIQLEKDFIRRIEEQGGRVIGKYDGALENVLCICDKGHEFYVKPSKIQQGGSMCNICGSSAGESLVAKILTKLGLDFRREVIDPNLIRLKFDFMLNYRNSKVYIEFDGIQHQENVLHFERRKGKDCFKNCRERDLLKNFVCRQLDNVRLIRLDHRWVKSEKKRDELESYLLNALNSKEKIVADPDMYTWIDDLPKQKTIDKYVIGPEDFPLPRRKAKDTIKKIPSPSSETPKKIIRSKKTVKSTEDLTDEIIETKTTKYKTTKIYENPPREVVTVRKKKVKIVIAKISSSSEE